MSVFHWNIYRNLAAVVDESHTWEMGSGKRHFSITISVVSGLCQIFLWRTKHIFRGKGLRRITVQNMHLRFTASAVVVRIFWLRLPSLYTTRGLLFYQRLLRVRADWLIFDSSLSVTSGGGIQNSKGRVQALFLSYRREAQRENLLAG